MPPDYPVRGQAHPSRAHLDAIGIPVWVRRGVAQPGVGAEPSPSTAAKQVEPPPSAVAGEREPSLPAADAAGPAGRALAPAAKQGEPPLSTVAGECEPSLPAADAAGPAGRALASIDARVRECRKCALHRTRTRTVFGVGRPDAACMFIGEAPGAEEDARGEPFVGRAGKLLDAMLAAIGLERGDVYIANIVKCRPPRNRDPHADEIAECSGYLRRQIETVSPRLLVAAGRVAAQSLLSTTKPIGQLRGRTYRYGEDRLPVIVMYHPAYFLRSPIEKRKGWDDLVRLRAMLSDHAAGGP